MNICKIHYTSDFADAYKKLPIEIKRAVDRKDKIFRENPYHPGLQTHKLSGATEQFFTMSALTKFINNFSHSSS